MAEADERTDLTHLLAAVAEGDTLSPAQAEEAVDAFMSGRADPVQMAGLLMGMRVRGVTSGEVAGGVRALRKAMIPVDFASPDLLVDTAGTGGGSVTTFNISTAAAIVVASAGVPVAKHGNRSFTSRSGSADVLEALGVRIDLSPERMGEVLAEAGIVFMFAPLLHPAMRHVGPVRRGLGVTTLMNILGPLTNPAGARRQVIGVADPGLLDLVAGALAELGHLHALVVHGEAGLDEVSPLGPTEVAEVSGTAIERYRIGPEELGLVPASEEDLAGGEPEENAAVIRAVLEGASGGARTAVLLNAAAALRCSGSVTEWAEGVSVAATCIDEGRASATLEALRVASNT